MNKYLLGNDGQPRLNAAGHKILNPDWLAANPDYAPAADEVKEGSTFTPDAAAQQWHDEQIEGLKRNQQRALTQLNKAKERATTAEAERDQLAAENAELKATLDSAGSSNEELKATLEKKHEIHAKNMQTELDKANQTITTLKAELSEHRYDGRIKSASVGVIRKGYEGPALSALKGMIKETESGDVICHDANGQELLDNQGDYLTVEDFVSGYFRKLYPDLCQKDVGADDSGDPTNRGASGEVNVFKEGEHFNRTHQFQMIKNDPNKARSLMKRAGYSESKMNRMMANVRPVNA